MISNAVKVMRNCERVADRVTLIAPPLWDARSNRQLPRGQTESAAIGQSPCANSTGCRKAKALPRRWKNLLQSPAGVPQLREALGSNVSGRLLRDPPGGGGPCGARRDAIPRMRHLIPDLSFAERHQREFASHRLDLLDVGLGSFDGVARASLEDLSSDSALRYRASSCGNHLTCGDRVSLPHRDVHDFASIFRRNINLCPLDASLRLDDPGRHSQATQPIDQFARSARAGRAAMKQIRDG